MKLRDKISAAFHPEEGDPELGSLERYCVTREFADDLLTKELQSLTIRGRSYVAHRIPSLEHDYIVIPFHDVAKLDGQSGFGVDDAYCWLTVKVNEFPQLQQDMRDEICLKARNITDDEFTELCQDIISGIKRLPQYQHAGGQVKGGL